MNMINIAIVGCGFFGQQLAYAFKKAGANIIAVLDIDLNLAQSLATTLSTTAYTDLAEMLTTSQPDLVVIATYNHTHKQLAESALKHRCAVFIETPFTLNKADSLSLLTLANTVQKPLFVGHLLRTLPGLIKAKQLLDQGALGVITVARANRQRWIASAKDKDWWKNDVALTGGKLLHEIHELDLLCWLLGKVKNVFAQSTNRVHQDTPDNHDIIQVLLQFENGVFGSLEMGTAYRSHKWGISIHGELGMLVINFFTSTLTLSFADGRREQFNLYDEFEADLSMRENSKATQKYNHLDGYCPFWLSRAAEIEAKHILEHFHSPQTCILSKLPNDAVCVANAAKQSIQEKTLIEVSYQ